jgi:parallel beta-helix repeat protein
MRTAIATIVLLSVLTGSAAAFDRFVNPRGTCGSGTVGNKPQHATIQDAVDAASPGDEIGVCPDEYLDGTIIPATKSGISLTGLGIVVIRAISIPSDSGFDVQADGVTIERFEIHGFDTAGIFVQANRATIQNNDVHHNEVGISLSGDGHRVRNNVVEANFQFALLAADVNGAEISGNRVTGGVVGILGFGVDQASTGTAIHHNVVVGTTFGIAVESAGGGTVRNNTVRFTEEAAIVASSTANVTILQNLVQKNLGSGIQVQDSTACGVGLNSVSFSGLSGTGHGIELTNVDGCLITRNNVSRNNPKDCIWDGLNANTFSGNSCGSEDPPGAWD